MAKVCWQDEVVFACAPNHELATRLSVTIDEIVSYPFICREEGSGPRDVICEYLAKYDKNLNDLDLTIELKSPESIKSAIEAGLGSSILSVAPVSKELRLGALAAVSLARPVRRPFSIVYQRQEFRRHAMEEFLAFAEEHYEEKRLMA